MKKRIVENLCLDQTRWTEYVSQPLDYADTPRFLWYEVVAQHVEKNFQYWLDNLDNDGIWEPNFSWGVDSDISRQVTQNWKGYIAVKRVKIFMNYGLVESD